MKNLQAKKQSASTDTAVKNLTKKTQATTNLELIKEDPEV